MERGLRQLSGFWRNTKGAAAVEFGFVIVPFLVLVFGALQLLLLALGQQMLETAAEASGRLVLTGQANALSQTQFHQSVCNVIPTILVCANVFVDLQPAPSFAGANTSAPTLTYDKNGNVTNAFQYNPGGTGSVMVLRLIYQWPLFNLPAFQLVNLPNNARLIMATAVFKNEAY